MLLVDTHLTIVTGVDIHMTATPPYNPIHPYVGMVIDPMDYLPFLGTNVTVNGLKRGVSDTSGILFTMSHIPLAGAFAMAPVIGHESMNFYSSKSVFADGSRLSPKGYMVMTCNDTGLPLSATTGKNKAGKKKLKPTLFAATSYSLPSSTGKPVFVGGPYIPDVGGAAMGLLSSIGFSSVLKAARKSGSKLGKKILTEFNHKVLKSDIMKKVPGTQKLSKKFCEMGFEPVELVGGVVVYEGTDFRFPSPVPLSWERSWYSDSAYTGWLGHGVHCVYDRCVQELPEEDAVALRLEDGRVAAFPALPVGGTFYLREERTTLRHTEKGYEAYDHETRLTSFFDLRGDDGLTYRMTRTENPDGLHTNRLQQRKPAEITDAAGRRVAASRDGTPGLHHTPCRS